MLSLLMPMLPEWASPDVDKGVVKVVYTGNPSDLAPIKQHVRRPSLNKAIQHRAKDPDDELQLVIVQSMWLTGLTLASLQADP